MNFIKNPTVIIIIIGLILGSSFFFYNRYRDSKKASESQTTTTTDVQIVGLTNVDPADFVAENQAELTLAETKAKTMNSEVQLNALEITFPGSLKPRSGNAIYIYDTTKDTAHHYTVSVSQESQNFIRAIIPKEDYLGALTPINLKSWKLSFVDALKVAEKNGGLDWRSKNTLTRLKMTLKNAAPKGWLYWLLEYQSDNSSFSAQVDAYSSRYVFPDETVSSPNSTSSLSSQNQWKHIIRF